MVFIGKKKNQLSLLAVRVDDPTGYGRVIQDDADQLLCIREETDATPSERKNNLINSGIYCIKKEFLMSAIDQIDSHNAQQEYYLTDLVKIAVVMGERAGCLLGDTAREIMGSTPWKIFKWWPAVWLKSPMNCLDFVKWYEL